MKAIKIETLSKRSYLCFDLSFTEINIILLYLILVLQQETQLQQNS